jgi:putative ABC transport system permease protein
VLQIALRGIRAQPFRYFATAIAIILGVAFFVATSVMTTSFRDTLNNSIAAAFADVDAAVRSTDSVSTEFFEIRQRIPASTANELLAVEGVAGAAAYLVGYGQVVTADGKALDGGSGPPQAFAWIDNPQLSPYVVADGVAPTGLDEIAIDVESLADGNFAIGDQVRVLPIPETQLFTIVGVLEPKNDDGNVDAQLLAFSFPGAEAVFGTSDVDQIFVAAADGVSEDELVASLKDSLPAGLEAVTGNELVDELGQLVGQVTGIINTALSIFAGIALFVGAFVIYNTFSITVVQRTREMALLRAIGASTGQVSRNVIVESLVIGIIASVFGSAAGIGLGWLLLQVLGSLGGGFDVDLSIPAGTMGAGVIIGTVITLVAAYLPARRGARVPPIEALRESSVESVDPSPWRTRIGVVLVAIGVVASVAAVTGGSVQLLAVSLPAVVLAVALLGPVVVRPFSRLIAIPMVRNGSITGELARENAARNPKRSATTSLTLVIGVALVVTATVFASSLSTSLRGQLEDQLLADHVVTVGNQIAQLGGGLDPSITPSIQALADVQTAVPFREAFVVINNDFEQVSGADTSGLADVLDLGVDEGTVTNLAVDEVAIRTDTANAAGLSLGDVVDVKFQQQTASLTVAGLYERDQFVGSWLVDNSTLDKNLPLSLDTKVLVTSVPGAGDNVAVEITGLVAADPTAEVETTGAYVDAQAGQIDQLLTLLYGLLGMSVFVALIGIVNTMALSIHERTRELGLLRAVGMTARQLRRAIRYESTIIALTGTFTGLVLGVFLGWVASKAADDVAPVFSLPLVSLVVIAFVGVIAGLVAGILPARRAGKLDVLEAISSS